MTTAPLAALDTRPSLHFAPQRNWMNDPNGLVFHDGVYHLYFQANPVGIGHGNLSWGHATSPDLSTWTEQPIAIRHDEDAQIFSGSIVVDHGNTSGFGTVEAPPLVAIYTAAAPGHQSQAIAFSTDGGYEWQKYEGNPVLDRDSSDFRDPKVFRYEGPSGSYWVMVAVEAQDRQVLFHRSDDLKNWEFLSSYGPRGPVGGVWECPDLFPLAVDGNDDDVRWVLLISLNPGGIAGGSGTHYVIGAFDGVNFVPDDGVDEEALDAAGKRSTARADLEGFGWLDFGRDCYAGVTFDGLARHERTLIAWMSNWDYAGSIPTRADASTRSAMTLPRRLSLVTGADGRPRLRQTPIAGPLREDVLVDLLDASVHGEEGLPRRGGRLRFELALGDAAGVAIHLGQDDEGRGGATLRYRRSGEMELERDPAGALPGGFGGHQSMTLTPAVEVAFDVWVDTVNPDVSSIEVVAEDGTRVLTALVPAWRSGSCVIGAVDGELAATRMSVARRAE